MGIVRAGAGESDTLAFGPAMRRTQRVRAQSDAACHVGPQVALYACVWRQKLTRADKGIEAGQGVPRRRERKCTEWSGGGGRPRCSRSTPTVIGPDMRRQHL